MYPGFNKVNYDGSLNFRIFRHLFLRNYINVWFYHLFNNVSFSVCWDFYEIWLYLLIVNIWLELLSQTLGFGSKFIEHNHITSFPQQYIQPRKSFKISFSLNFPDNHQSLSKQQNTKLFPIAHQFCFRGRPGITILMNVFLVSVTEPHIN